MSTAQTIQELAKIAALADTDDVQRLVALRDGLHQFASDSDSNIGERCISVANRTAELVEQIVLRELEDTAQALAQIHEALDYLQLRTEAMSQGTDACDDLALPSIIRDGASDTAGADANEAADSELLDSWIASQGRQSTAEDVYPPRAPKTPPCRPRARRGQLALPGVDDDTRDT